MGLTTSGPSASARRPANNCCRWDRLSADCWNWFRSFSSAGHFNQGAQAPSAVLRRIDYTAQAFAQGLASSVGVGVNGSRQPQGMEAMKLALRQPGFLRDASKI